MDDFEKRYWKAWPRWTLRNCWREYNGLRGFTLFGFWWSPGGSIGLTIFNFSVEFNPHHEEINA